MKEIQSIVKLYLFRQMQNTNFGGHPHKIGILLGKDVLQTCMDNSQLINYFLLYVQEVLTKFIVSYYKKGQDFLDRQYQCTFQLSSYLYLFLPPLFSGVSIYQSLFRHYMSTHLAGRASTTYTLSNLFSSLISMVFLLDGNSVIGAHVESNLCYLKCLRHLIRSRAVINRMFFSKETYFPSCVRI